MKPTKRRRTAIEHSDSIETKKLHIDSNRKSVTHLEDLSNEVIYEIFEFLEIYHMNDAFLNLNKRFDNLLTYSTLPIKINISSMSKSTLRQYCQQIINPNKHRITSLRLPNIFTVDILFTSPRIIKKFVRLETLILDNIESIYFEDFLLYHLASVFSLRSLVVVLIDQVPNKNTFYRSIFRLPVLKYCKLSFQACPDSNSIRIATNESSSIEHLVIYSDSNLDDLSSILSYVPQLRRLSWHKISGLSGKQADIQGLTLKHLTHVSLELQYMKFDQFEPLIINLFQQIEVLHISTRFDRAYLDSNRWERLISSYMPYLRIFDIEHRSSAHTLNDLPLTCMSLNNLFTSSFWCEHQWFFAHQCFWQGNWNQVIFYSTNPYRRKHYTLYGETDKEICFHRQETNLSVVRHVHIQGEKSLMSCTNYFPNATELTLSHVFDESIDQTINNLNRILPLIQLTKLNIDGDGRFCFGKVIHLLQFTPNIDILRVYSMLLYTTDSVSIEKSESFQLVSNTNMIKNFTVESECRFEQMKLLVNLCPRLQHINMDIYWRDFSSIFELLLANINNNPGHLFSICLKQGFISTIQKLLDLSKSKKWLDEYSKKLIDKKLYLWW